MGYAIIAFLIVFLLLSSGLLLLFYREALWRRLSNVLVERGRRPGFVERFKRTQTGEPHASFAELIRRSAPGGNKTPAVQQRLTLAGYRQAYHRKLFSASKLALPALLDVLAAVTGLYQWNAFLVFVCAAGLGYLLPDYWLEYRIKARAKSLEQGLPDLLDLMVVCLEAGLSIDQAAIRSSEEMSFSHPAIADVRSAARFPPVVPENVPVQGVDRPGIVRRGDVENAVDLKNRSRESWGSAGRSRHGHRLLGHAAGDGGRPRRRSEEPAFATAGAGRQAPHPGEREVSHVGRVDLAERTVATLGIVARVGRPRVGGGPGRQRGIQSLASQRLASQTPGRQEKQCRCSRHRATSKSASTEMQDDAGPPAGHFNVTRYAVRLWISASRHCGSMSMCHCSGLVTTTLGIESCLAKLRYVPSGSRSATMKAET